jgi:membrane associated rhomboid family serine protease
MFPVSDVIPSRTRPVVTLALMFLVSGAFLYQVQLDDAGLESLLDTYGILPHAITPKRLVGALFLHAGWLHAAVNVLYVWLFGPNVEAAFGRWRFVLFYFAAGALSVVLQALVHAPLAAPVIGASGAVAAILGAYLVLYPQSRVLTVFFAVLYLDVIEIPAMAFVGAWFVLQLASDIGALGLPVIAGPTAFWSHVAGFTIGLACGAYARWRGGVLRTYWGRDGSR